MVEKRSGSGLVGEVLTRMSLNMMWLKERGEKDVKLPKVFVDGHTGVRVSLVKDFVNCETEKDGVVLNGGCFRIRDNKIEPVEGIFYIPKVNVNPVGFGQRAWLDYYTTEYLVYNQVKNAEEKVMKLTDKGRWLITVKGNDIKVYLDAEEGKVVKYKLVGQQDKLHVIRAPPVLFKPAGYRVVKNISVNEYDIGFEYEVMEFRAFSFNGTAKIVYPLYGITDAVIRGPGHEDVTLKLYPSYLYLFTYPSA
jgi:hypothetical protein